MVTLEEFSRLELRVARVVKAQAHPNADKLLVLTIDTGSNQKEIVAGIARHYLPEELVGKLIVVVDNLQSATIRGVASQGMLLAAQDQGTLALWVPERPITPGSLVR